MYKEEIKRSLVQTLAFFALFEKGLTREELIQYFYVPKEEKGYLRYCRQNKVEIFHRMDGFLKDGTFDENKGVYSLKGTTVGDLEKYTSKYAKKSQLVLPFLAHIPFVRMVAIGNTLAFGAAEEGSDIDLFIVIEKGYLWLARFFVTFFLHIMGVRRHGAKIAGRFCLSFYTDTSKLDLTEIMFQPDDVYMKFWITSLKPVVGESTYKSFIKRNLDTIKESFPFWKLEKEYLYLKKSVQDRTLLQKINEFILKSFIGKKLGKILKHFQKSKVEKNSLEKMENPSIIISDHMLKFHNNDKRMYYQDLWKSLVKKHT